MKNTKAKIYANLIITINGNKKVVYSFISYRQLHVSFITVGIEKKSNPIKLSRTFAKARV